MTNLADRLDAVRRLPPPRMRRAIRQDAGVTQQDVAREMGVHRMTIARWEAGSHQPRGARLVDYIRVLEMLAGSNS